ncbi:hypothetical protein [Streptomyces sp. NBC_01320]|uniref:hypothetical protein n=1 Tax=Streptomyces sp. NBC_01320 TaxID=2903824 RepID=UPI003FA3B9D3
MRPVMRPARASGATEQRTPPSSADHQRTAGLTRSVAPDPPQLAYPARGIGTPWEPRSTAAADAVAAVLGRSRTLLLTELDTVPSQCA